MQPGDLIGNALEVTATPRDFLPPLESAEIVAAARTLRTAQREYGRDPCADRLAWLREWERRLDAMLEGGR